MCHESQELNQDKRPKIQRNKASFFLRGSGVSNDTKMVINPVRSWPYWLYHCRSTPLPTVSHGLTMVEKFLNSIHCSRVDGIAPLEIHPALEPAKKLYLREHLYPVNSH